MNSAFVKGALENLKHAGFSLQDTATSSSTSTSPSIMSGVGEKVDSGDGPMLQLFVKVRFWRLLWWHISIPCYSALFCTVQYGTVPHYIERVLISYVRISITCE